MTLIAIRKDVFMKKGKDDPSEDDPRPPIEIQYDKNRIEFQKNNAPDRWHEYEPSIEPKYLYND